MLVICVLFGCLATVDTKTSSEHMLVSHRSFGHLIKGILNGGDLLKLKQRVQLLLIETKLKQRLEGLVHILE